MEKTRKVFYDLWWLSVPLSLAGIVLLLLLHVRWVLGGGLRNWDADSFLSWLALGLGLTLWLLIPAIIYLATAPATDRRGQRMTMAWQRCVQELGDWLALPQALAYFLVRWGILLVAVGFTGWFLLGGGDLDLEDLDWITPASIRFALFLLLYLNVTVIAGVVAGMLTLLRSEPVEKPSVSQTSLQRREKT